MTWQRIDDDTYIDDTLVTCAEYQLFIDEMREWIRFYQPDHWKSYQFPNKQAREPILGVQPSDAQSFCEWLTRSSDRKWHYRLPTSAEAAEYFSGLAVGKSPLGYWLRSDEDGNSSFAWVGSIPTNPRRLDLVFARLVDLTQPFDTGYARKLAKSIKSSNIINLDFVLSRDHTYQSYLESNPLLASDHKRDDYFLRRRIHEIVEIISYAFHWADISFYKFEGEHILETNQREEILHLKNTSRDLEMTLENRFLARTSVDAIQRANAELSTSTKSVLHNSYISSLTNARLTAVKLFLELDTLQQRIAGRSPALEGIRLVKERIK